MPFDRRSRGGSPTQPGATRRGWRTQSCLLPSTARLRRARGSQTTPRPHGEPASWEANRAPVPTGARRYKRVHRELRRTRRGLPAPWRFASPSVRTTLAPTTTTLDSAYLETQYSELVEAVCLGEAAGGDMWDPVFVHIGKTHARMRADEHSQECRAKLAARGRAAAERRRAAAAA